MRQATGISGLIGISIVMIGVVILVFLASLDYTKAFKVKNRIVDIIERYDDGYSVNNRERIDAEILSVLKNVGYRLNTRNRSCPKRNGADPIEHRSQNYRYCIYQYQSKRGYYYGVTAYMYMDLPLIGELIEIPVSGETKVFYHVIDNHGLPDN